MVTFSVPQLILVCVGVVHQIQLIHLKAPLFWMLPKMVSFAVLVNRRVRSQAEM
jgi:hypothetical protein